MKTSPHPRLAPRVILLVRHVLVTAFTLLRQCCQDNREPLSSLTEDDITLRLHAIIENDLRQKGTTVLGFNRRTFGTVSRQAETVNYNFTATQKKPDMVFQLCSDNEPQRVISNQNALFVECKPVDSTHPAGSKYCDDGLIRFVRGDYGWDMQDALMIAYTREGRTISKHLHPAISVRAHLETEQEITPTFTALAPADALTERLHVSVHRRPFHWCGGKGAACPITIYHSWHQAV